MQGPMSLLKLEAIFGPMILPSPNQAVINVLALSKTIKLADWPRRYGVTAISPAIINAEEGYLFSTHDSMGTGLRPSTRRRKWVEYRGQPTRFAPVMEVPGFIEIPDLEKLKEPHVSNIRNGLREGMRLGGSIPQPVSNPLPLGLLPLQDARGDDKGRSSPLDLIWVSPGIRTLTVYLSTWPTPPPSSHGWQWSKFLSFGRPWDMSAQRVWPITTITAHWLGVRLRAKPTSLKTFHLMSVGLTVFLFQAICLLLARYLLTVFLYFIGIQCLDLEYFFLSVLEKHDG